MNEYKRVPTFRDRKEPRSPFGEVVGFMEGAYRLLQRIQRLNGTNAFDNNNIKLYICEATYVFAPSWCVPRVDDEGSDSIGVDELEDPLIALGLVDNRQ